MTHTQVKTHFYYAYNYVTTPDSRFIDDPHYVETSNGASVFGSLALGIIEVGRHSNNSVCDGHAQVSFSSFLTKKLSIIPKKKKQ